MSSNLRASAFSLWPRILRKSILLLCLLLIVALLASLVPQASVRGPTRRTACSANLKAIAVACLVYAESHSGQLPPSLGVLMGGPRAFLVPKQLFCPDGGRPYVYPNVA